MFIFSGRIAKLPMEELVGFFQNSLPVNFIYDDDQVVESLQSCMEELKKSKLDTPPPNDKDNELPQKPFGLFVPPSVEQIIGRRTIESDTEIINNPKRLSVREVRPSIPADGGPAWLPLSQRLSEASGGAMNSSAGEGSSNFGSVSVSATGTDPYDSRQSMTDYNSSRTSFPNSEVASMMTNNSHGIASAASSLSALNHSLSVSQPVILPNGYENDGTAIGKVDSIYEQSLEQTFEQMEGVNYYGGVTVVEVGRDIRASSEPPNVAYSDTTTPRATPNSTPIATPAATPNDFPDGNSVVDMQGVQQNSGASQTLLQTRTFSVTQSSNQQASFGASVSQTGVSAHKGPAVLTNATLELHNQQQQLVNHSVHNYSSADRGMVTPTAHSHTPSSGHPTPVGHLSPEDPVGALFNRAFVTDNNYNSSSNVSPAQRPITMKIQAVTPVNTKSSPPLYRREMQQSPPTNGQHLVKSPNSHYVSVAPSVRRHTPSGSQSPTRSPTEKYISNSKPAYTVTVGHVSPVKSNKQMSPVKYNQPTSPVNRSGPTSPVNHYQQPSPVKPYTPPSVYQSPTRQRNYMGHNSSHTSPTSPNVTSWSDDIIIPAEYSASMQKPLPSNRMSPQKLPARQSPTKRNSQTLTQVVYL